VPDVEHRRDRGDPGDGLLREGPAVGDGPDELLVDVDGAPAHAGDHAGLLQIVAGQPGEDEVLLRGVFAHHSQDFDAESLDPGAVSEIAETVALLAGMDPGDFENRGRSGRAAANEGRRQDARCQSDFSHLSTPYNRLDAPFHSVLRDSPKRIEFVDLTKFRVLRSSRRPWRQEEVDTT
jgi:hypothetical protein